ncbi:hypothetical protein [Kocuria sp.]|uniref:hypothetical protein n=1 Tax=Kocuria sp. TaxID=1871328 RepID=UPI0026DFE555|nr:hypothetical protein [Kocuria sp.]
MTRASGAGRAQHEYMSFEDLPQNWSTLPLNTPGLGADVVDLIVSISDRHQNTMLVELCDSHGVGHPAPIKIGGMHWSCSDAERTEVATSIAQLVEHGPEDVGAMLVAVSSPHTLPATVTQAWHESMTAALQKANCRLLGFYSATPQDVREVTG